ncbi:MAG: hypothetical protein AABZ39_15040 [Spirochaetota bacterium]
MYKNTWGDPDFPNFSRYFTEMFSADSEVTDAAYRMGLNVFFSSVKKYTPTLSESDSDWLPSIYIYLGIGAVDAAIRDSNEVTFSGGSSYCHTPVSGNIPPKFNPENKWVKRCLTAYAYLLSVWEEDFCFIPYIHRSPLDAANGYRGNDLFYDFYDKPDAVKDLARSCADWIIAFEKYCVRENNAPEGWGRAVWGTYIDENALFVNGDIVDLIAPDLIREFEQPYTEAVFTATGPGFFHHHAIGLDKVSLIAERNAMHVQAILSDPSTPIPAEVITRDEQLATEVCNASLKAPIMLCGFSPDSIDALIPIIREGRFILAPGVDDAAYEVMRKKLDRYRLCL